MSDISLSIPTAHYTIKYYQIQATKPPFVFRSLDQVSRLIYLTTRLCWSSPLEPLDQVVVVLQCSDTVVVAEVSSIVISSRAMD